MLKDKEVVSDPQRQYEIAREVHAEQHGGINKTTATIAEKFHWVRIKETVSLVIKDCPDCKESAAKIPVVRPASNTETATGGQGATSQPRKAATAQEVSNNMIEQLIHFDSDQPTMDNSRGASLSKSPELPSQRSAPVANMRSLQDYTGIPLDPQIMQSGPAQEFPEGMGQVAEYSRSNERGGNFDGVVDLTGDGQEVQQHADTRMATDRHVREGDDPMGWRDSHGGHDGGSGRQDDEMGGLGQSWEGGA